MKSLNFVWGLRARIKEWPKNESWEMQIAIVKKFEIYNQWVFTFIY